MSLFQNPTKSIPESDEQIIRVPLDRADIGGRPSQMPAQSKAPGMGISHVPNAGSMPGGK
jgi:hypothetical protein